MAEPIELPMMGEAQRQSWHALMELYESIPSDWTLIGGQLVHLHCAERAPGRDVLQMRATDDIDAVLNVRAAQGIHNSFTGVLKDMGFTTETTGQGFQHRWRRDLAQIDVLFPEGIGRRAARPGAGGAPTLESPGTTQALDRSEAVTVLVEGRIGTVLRPNLIGALVGKAAARNEVASDPARERHCIDFVILATLVSARDFRDVKLRRTDRSRLRKMIGHCRSNASAMAVENAAEALERLERGAKLI